MGLIENKNTNAVETTHGVKSIEGAASLVKLMQDGTYGQPKPQTAKEIVKESVKITEKNAEKLKRDAVVSIVGISQSNRRIHEREQHDSV